MENGFASGDAYRISARRAFGLFRPGVYS